MATTPNPNPPLRDHDSSRMQADPTCQNAGHQCGAFSLSQRSPAPSTSVSVPNDHDGDDNGWAGTVRPVAGPPGQSSRGY